MKQINFIYFDVGGVAMLDFAFTRSYKWAELKNDLGINDDLVRRNFDELFKLYEPEICIGQNTSEFVAQAKVKLGIKFPENYSLVEDISNRFESNIKLQALIASFKNQYHLGLLTNMYPGMFTAITERGLLPDVAWDAVIDSSTIGYRKPQAEIYKIAEKEAKTAPEKILFLDDKLENIEGAKARGWQTFHYNTADLDGSNLKLKALLLD